MIPKYYLLLPFFLSHFVALSNSKWDNFLKVLPLLDFPFAVDSSLSITATLVSKQCVFDYFLTPIRKINGKEDSTLDQNKCFGVLNINDFDIKEYKQWKNTSWVVPDSNYVYNPVQPGYVLCLGKFHFNGNRIGVLWKFIQTNLSLWHGNSFVLFLYDDNGNCLNYSVVGMEINMGLDYKIFDGFRYKISSALTEDLQIKSKIVETGNEFYLTDRQKGLHDDEIKDEEGIDVEIERDAGIITFPKKKTKILYIDYNLDQHRPCLILK